MEKAKLKVDVWRLIIELLIISVFFENVKIVSVMGTAFKPTHIVLIIAIIAGICQRYVLKRDLAIGIFYLILPCLPLYRINDKIEWFKSYAIYVMIVLFLIFAFRRFLEKFKSNFKHYTKLLIYIIALTQILGVVQFICMNFFHYFFLRDVFGSFEYQRNIFNMSSGFYRAYSVYHEPSFFGLVTLTSIAIMFSVGKELFSQRQYSLFLILNVLAVFVSLSASCLIIFLILLVVHTFVMDETTVNKAISVVLLIAALLVLAFSTNLLAPVRRLFTEVNLENSSGYERTVTQWRYVQKTMEYFPFLGRGLGQEGNVDVIGKIGLYSAINNALAGIVVNLGLSSLFFYIPLLWRGVRDCSLLKKCLVPVITILGIYASTGAYISVDTFNMVILLCCVENVMLYSQNDGET